MDSGLAEFMEAHAVATEDYISLRKIAVSASDAWGLPPGKHEVRFHWGVEGGLEEVLVVRMNTARIRSIRRV